MMSGALIETSAGRMRDEVEKNQGLYTNCEEIRDKLIIEGKWIYGSC